MERRTQTQEVFRKPMEEARGGLVMAKMTVMGEKGQAALRSLSGLDNWGDVSNTALASRKPDLGHRAMKLLAREDGYTHLFPFRFLKLEMPNLSAHPEPGLWQ